jgi:hypothetical protein
MQASLQYIQYMQYMQYIQYMQYMQYGGYVQYCSAYVWHRCRTVATQLLAN